MTFHRYALYWTPPPGPFAAFGSAWLGWSILAGEAVAHPAAPFPLAEITKRPRKYGLHATLKAPFRLANGHSEAALFEAAQAATASLAPFDLPRLQVQRIGRFLALTPTAPSPALMHTAAHLVEALDPFRAPPTEAELAKRRAKRLSPSQDALLARWGYPYVMEEFRFHLTLTGPLDPEQVVPVSDYLESALAPHLGPHRVWDVTLCGADGEGRFHEIARLPLGISAKG